MFNITHNEFAAVINHAHQDEICYAIIHSFGRTIVYANCYGNIKSSFFTSLADAINTVKLIAPPVANIYQIIHAD